MDVRGQAKCENWAGKRENLAQNSGITDNGDRVGMPTCPLPNLVLAEHLGWRARLGPSVGG